MIAAAAVSMVVALASSGAQALEGQPACGGRKRFDSQFRGAIVGRDPEAIIRMLPKQLVACDDERYIERDAMARPLRDPKSRLWTAVFGGAEVRSDLDLVNRGVTHSLRELMVRPDLEVEAAPGRSSGAGLCLQYRGNGGRWWAEVCGTCVRGQWSISSWTAVCYL